MRYEACMAQAMVMSVTINSSSKTSIAAHIPRQQQQH